MDLPRKWPGRVKVRQALTLLRLSGCCTHAVQHYAAQNKPTQKRRYPWFREEFYWNLYRIHPNLNRIGR